MISFSTTPSFRPQPAEVLKKDQPIKNLYHQPSHRQGAYQQACTQVLHSTAQYNILPEKIAQVQKFHDSVADFHSTLSDFSEFCGSTLNLGNHTAQTTHVQVLKQAYRTLIHKTHGGRFMFSGARGDVPPFEDLQAQTTIDQYQGSTLPYTVTWGPAEAFEVHHFPHLSATTDQGNTLHSLWTLLHDLDKVSNSQEAQTWFEDNQPLLTDIQALLHQWQEESHQTLGRLTRYQDKIQAQVHQGAAEKAQHEDPILPSEEMAVQLNALKKAQSKDILEKELMRHRFVQRLALYR